MSIADLQLSESTRKALLDFLKEKEIEDESHNDIKSEEVYDINLFSENWQLSQFWYSNETASAIANESKTDGKVGFISFPSAYMAYKRLFQSKTTLFEFDERFSCFEDFVFYDFNRPTRINQALHNTFDVLVIDPPFLSDECLTKMLETAKLLGTIDCRIIICTGKVMEPLILNLCGAHLIEFKPNHQKLRLANDFSCFVNYVSSNKSFT